MEVARSRLAPFSKRRTDFDNQIDAQIKVMKITKRALYRRQLHGLKLILAGTHSREGAAVMMKRTSIDVR